MTDLRAGLDDRLAEWAGLVPDGELVPSVDELTERLDGLARSEPGLCQMRRIGTSREGRALHVLSIGTAQRSVLVVGGPHPNEPVGYATIGFLAGLVMERPELRHGVSWHFLPCVDPDGAALNSEWTSTPLDLQVEHRYFYRPAMTEQPEWTFPIPWRDGTHRFGLPENQALADLVDELRPAVAVSLHNSEFGDPFVILSHDVPGLAAQIEAITERHGLPTTHATPGDVVGWPVLGRGIFQMPPIDELVIRDHTQTTPAYGSHLTHHAARHGTLTLLPEVPRWRSATVYQDSPPTALTTLADTLITETTTVATHLEQAGLLDTPFGRAAADTIAVADTVTRTWHDHATHRTTVTATELAEAHYTRAMLTLRTTGMALRSAHETPPNPTTPDARTSLQALLTNRVQQIKHELQITPVALRHLVAVQASTAIAASLLTP